MYHFAVLALLGLATLEVTKVLEDFVPAVSRLHRLLPFVLGIAVAVGLDWSLFTGFGIDLRDQDVGTWITGVVIGALATAWHAAFGWLGVREERTSDQHQPGKPRMAA